ncbi:antibiotic biosynthesis monooxygenase family protein [Actinomadura kijaniata]|uniref:antibiotic biosynthesis monooxygenase family protein n=1 Tax=Actinomadura kijaniata TaxID=46161 RepID=UPI00082AA627|nr:antibiotic biosynthesis monooxygenase family protein [Actinomadura kijaniata]
MSVFVVVSARIRPGTEAGFEEAFAKVRQSVRGTPGHRSDRLLASTREPGRYLLLAEWESEEAFLAWEESPVHRELTTPMRPYWAGAVERTIFGVAVDDPAS